MVEADHAHQPRLVLHLDLDVAGALQQRQQVGGGLLPPVHLAPLQGGAGGRGIRDGVPLDAVHPGDLAAGEEAHRLVARLVAGEALVDRARAGHPLVGHPAEGAAADDLRHLRRGRVAGEALLHHRAVGGRLGQCGGEQREGLLQLHQEDAVGDRRHLIGDGADVLAEHVGAGPAVDAGDGIAGQDRRAVVEGDALAQGDAPGAAVILDDMAFDQLRLGGVVAVEAVELVIDHHAVVAGHQRRVEHRVEQRQVGLRNEPKHAGRPRGALGAQDTRTCHGGRCGPCRQSQKITTIHDGPPPCNPQLAPHRRATPSTPAVEYRRRATCDAAHCFHANALASTSRFWCHQ